MEDVVVEAPKEFTHYLKHNKKVHLDTYLVNSEEELDKMIEMVLSTCSKDIDSYNNLDIGHSITLAVDAVSNFLEFGLVDKSSKSENGEVTYDIAPLKGVIE